MKFRLFQKADKMTWIYLILVVIVGGAILCAMVKIIWVDGNEWRTRGNNRVEDIRPDYAHRGNIYSSDGQILATTIPVCDLYLDMGRWKKTYEDGKIVHDKNDSVVYEAQIPDSCFNQYLDKICLILHRDNPKNTASYYKDLLLAERSKEKPNRCFRVQRNMAYSAWMEIVETPGWGRGVVKHVNESNGQRSVIRNVRAHIYNNLAENTVGFRNSIEEDTYTGLEGFYDSILRGQDGFYKYRRLTRGVWLKDENSQRGFRNYNDDDGMTIDSTVMQKKIDGKDIVSTIDTRYQDIAEAALRRALLQYYGTSGCAILMEVKTGYVLACSSLSIDTARHNYYEMSDRNVACADIYEPGSTFKTAILTAMMNDTKIQFDTNERVRTGKKQFTDDPRTLITDGSHSQIDTVSIPQVLAKSSNVGMCELGWKYYYKRRTELRDMVATIFPYDPLYLDLKVNEPKGNIIDLHPDRSFLNFCFGYSNNTTAMQLITFYNAIAGGGRMVKPLFCKAIGSNGKFSTIEPVVLKDNICSPETIKTLKEMLVGVVDHGTGSSIKNASYGIAGKTGTAYYSYRDHTRYNASFAGFFPADNPKYTCLVVVKNVPAHGQQAAAPVFKRIADCVMAIDKDLGNTQPNRQRDTLYAPPEAKQTPAIKEGSVPNCTGLTVRDAIATLRAAGLKVKFNGYGRVTSQTPKPGKAIPANKTVYLTLK